MSGTPFGRWTLATDTVGLLPLSDDQVACKAVRLQFEANLLKNPERHETLGQRLRKVRMALGWRSYQMADILGISRRRLTDWERSAVTPNWFYLTLFLLVTGQTWERLTEGVGPTSRQVWHKKRIMMIAPHKRREIPTHLLCAGSGEKPRKRRCPVCGKSKLRADGTVKAHPVPKVKNEGGI